jgi:hypothetical protein
MHHDRDEGVDLASIDELLAADAGPDLETDVDAPGSGRGAAVARQVFRAVLVAALCAGALDVVLLPLGVKVPYPLLFSFFFALVVLRRALRQVAAPRLRLGAVPTTAPGTRIDPTDLPDGMQLALGRWDARLSWSERDPPRFNTAVRSRMAEIVEERLRQHHGFTAASDPRRAGELMGERLWTFLFSPLARTPNPGELAAVVDDMEKL